MLMKKGFSIILKGIPQTTKAFKIECSIIPARSFDNVSSLSQKLESDCVFALYAVFSKDSLTPSLSATIYIYLFLISSSMYSHSCAKWTCSLLTAPLLYLQLHALHLAPKCPGCFEG